MTLSSLVYWVYDFYDPRNRGLYLMGGRERDVFRFLGLSGLPILPPYKSWPLLSGGEGRVAYFDSFVNWIYKPFPLIVGGRMEGVFLTLYF